MSEFTLKQLEYFVAVAETGSILEAANQTMMSPTAVGTGLDQLESALGLTLTVRRKSKGVFLTPAGTKVLEEAVQLLGSSRRLRGMAQELSGQMSGPLRIGCIPNLSRWMMPATIKYFRDTFPAVEVELVEREARQLQSMVRVGDVEAAFLYTNQLSAGLDAIRITELRVRVLISNESTWSAHDRVRLADLSDLPAILLDVSPTRQFLEELLRTVGFSGSIQWCSADVEAVRSMVAHGLGFTLMFGIGSNLTFDGLLLKSLEIADQVPLNGVSLCLSAETTCTAPTAELIEFARTRLPPPVRSIDTEVLSEYTTEEEHTP